MIAEIVNSNYDYYVYGDVGTVQFWKDGTSTEVCH